MCRTMEIIHYPYPQQLPRLLLLQIEQRHGGQRSSGARGKDALALGEQRVGSCLHGNRKCLEMLARAGTLAQRDLFL